MNSSVIWQAVEALGTIGAFACALFVLARDGRRIKSGEARALSEKIERAQDAADRWHDTDEAKAMRADIHSLEGRTDKVEEKLTNVATKADVAKLEASLRGVDHRVGNAAKGVDRIESLLMKKALSQS